MSLQQVMLFGKDLDRMTEFYRDVLELEPIEHTRLNNWVEFSGDGARFSLHTIPPAIASGIQIDSPPRASEQAGVKLTFAVRDAELCRRLLLEAADIRGLADDDALYRVEELRARGVRRQVERLAQRA
jgi:catechol 2,3-dioxygenase-like lactoylglutathione lyase family enzyme